MHTNMSNKSHIRQIRAKIILTQFIESLYFSEMRQKWECDDYGSFMSGGQGAPGSNPGIPTAENQSLTEVFPSK